MALVGVAVATVVKLALRPLAREDEAALGFFAAVMFAAWYGGLPSGLLATVVSAFVSDYFFLSPVYDFSIRSPSDCMRLIQFLVEGTLISVLGGSLRSARVRADAQRERAEAANRAKDDFLATVSHELRTPLGGVMLWSKLLKSGTLTEDRRRAALDKIIECAEDQRQIVEDLLDTSSIVAGKMRLERRPIDLATVVRTAVDVARPGAHSHDIALELSPAPCAMVLGDPARLAQVVSNLLTNALKFTPAGGRIEVALACDGDKVRVAVTDNGEGISPEYLPRVFDRFSQGDMTLTRRHGGLGLGLSIVKDIVALHGGTIRAASKGTGRGASFTVELPLLDQTLTPPA
ncbi:MAG TPA: ATP-binding protein [Tepidisphaeraceae bacterium]|nr:ATP-binding protein [Tepidisphaeraceae bacterium]